MSIYVDAIMGITLDCYDISNLPKRFINVDGNGCVSVVKSEIEKYSEDDQHALYIILQGNSNMVKDIYKDFDPRCQEEINFEKAREKHVEKCRKKKQENKEIYFSWDEISDSINFEILYSIALKNPKLMKCLNKCGTFPCSISREEMKAKSEEKCETKLKEVINIIKQNFK